MANLPSTSPPNNAPIDANKIPGLTFVAGTLGTSDTLGTSPIIRAAGNPLTGAQYVEVLGGVTVAGGSNVNVVSGTMGTVGNIGQIHNAGTIQALPQVSVGTIPQVSIGTFPNINGGTLNLTVRVGNLGTVESGTITIANPTGTTVTVDHGSVTITAGTVTDGTITRIGNVGTIESGTININSIPQVSVGTVPQISIGTIPNVNVATGTQQTLGTVGVVNSGTLNAITTVTTVSNVINGSVNILSGSVSGTILGGTIQNLNAGTITSVSEIVKGTVTQVTTVSNLTNGSVNILTGTINSVSNLAGGTTQISKIPVQVGTPYHVRGTTGAAVWGTIISAAGAGTKQYVSNVSVVVVSGTVDVAVTNIGVGGSTGAGVFVRGQFVPSAGINKDYDPVIPSGTNGTLSYWLGGAGTVDIMVNYWQGV